MTDLHAPALALIPEFDARPAGDCILVRVGNEVRYVTPQGIIAADDPQAYVNALFECELR